MCDNTTERVALLGGQLCDNTTEKAALSCNMLWSQHPYEVVMSFTRSKPGPRAVRKIGRNLSGTTHPTLPPIGGRPTSLSWGKVGGIGPSIVVNRVSKVVSQVLQWTLPCHNGLNKESKHGEHSKSSILDFLHL